MDKIKWTKFLNPLTPRAYETAIHLTQPNFKKKLKISRFRCDLKRLVFRLLRYTKIVQIITWDERKNLDNLKHYKSMQLFPRRKEPYIPNRSFLKILLAMKLTALLLLIACVHVSGNGFSQKIAWSGMPITWPAIFRGIPLNKSWMLCWKINH